MKTTSLSLALAAGAGSVLATAPPAYGDGSSAPPAYTSSSVVAPVSSSVPYDPSSSAPAAYPSSSGPGVYPTGSYIPTGYSNSWHPSGYSTGYGTGAASTGCTTTYTSTCVETSTLIYRSATSYAPYTITHTLTTSYPGSCPSSIPVSPVSSSVPASYPSGSAPGGYPTGSAPGGYPSGTSPAESSPVESSPVESSPVESSPAAVTNTVTNTKYVCPCDITADPVPTRTPGEVYVTQYTTEYETTCPEAGHETATFTYGDWTSIYTKYSLTTTTDIITQTLTEPGYSTDPVETTAPAGYPSESSAGAYPTGYPSGYASGSAAPYPSGSGSSGWAYPSGSGSSGWGYPSGTGSSAGPYPTGTGYTSSSLYPTGTGYTSSSLYSTGVSSSAAPTATSGCVPCEGQPGNDPATWCGYDINTDWYEFTPKTCKTVEFHWTITNETVSPDGVPRVGLVVDGQLPGPLIEANWGDEIVVHVTSQLDAASLNGTSIHFHGIRQNGTNEMDGVSSITQCPIAPGSSYTYRWTAASYGTSWWHAHYALQTYEGIFGPMIIHGPAAAEYDDEQMIVLQDWNHIPVSTLYEPSVQVANGARGTPTLDTGLINGMNVWQGTGQRFEMTVESGKSYRLRLVNSAMQSTFVFYVDQHPLEVIAMDFVPIHPYTTDSVVINIGQRYDVIIKANQASSDYWIRADNQQPCAPLNNLDIKGIIHYADGPGAEPTTQALNYPPTCLDEPLASLVPIVSLDAGTASQTLGPAPAPAPNAGGFTAAIGPGPTTPTLFKWTLSGTTFFAEWDHPTLQQIYENGTVPDTSGNLAIEVPNLGEWVYVIIQTPIPLPHPIHLHGHDFFILAQGLGTYTATVPLNLNNPPRRDVAVMPADPTTGTPGYLVLAFETSNPGVWLLHCHIGWHNAMGFALQIIENLAGIADTIKYGGQIEDTCNSWSTYASAYDVVTSDSGV